MGGKYRSMKTGKYVSEYYAKRHPKTVRRERDERGVEKLSAERERRIMDFCIAKAREIQTELWSSAGDHTADVQALDGLIETWSYLRSLHSGIVEEEAENAKTVIIDVDKVSKGRGVE